MTKIIDSWKLAYTLSSMNSETPTPGFLTAVHCLHFLTSNRQVLLSREIWLIFICSIFVNGVVHFPELKGASLELLSKLIPEHARKQFPSMVCWGCTICHCSFLPHTCHRYLIFNLFFLIFLWTHFWWLNSSISFFIVSGVCCSYLCNFIWRSYLRTNLLILVWILLFTPFFVLTIFYLIFLFYSKILCSSLGGVWFNYRNHHVYWVWWQWGIHMVRWSARLFWVIFKYSRIIFKYSS